MTRYFGGLLFAVMIAMALTTASAHEAHRKDMSDAEIAEMKKAAETAPDKRNMASADGADHNGGGRSADTHSEMTDERLEDAAFDPADFFGRLHPALVHFPIALFLAAGLAELILFARPASGLEPTVRFLVYTGAAGGVVATVLGWLAGGIRLSDRSETLGLHRWTGTGIAIAGLVAAILVQRAQPNRILLRFILAGLAAAILFQGYWGAEMSMGPNHMGM